MIDWQRTYSSHLSGIQFVFDWVFCTIHPRFIALHSVPWPDLAWPLAAMVVVVWGILDLGVNDAVDKTSNSVQQMITSLYLNSTQTQHKKRIFLLVHPLFVGSNVTVWIWPYKPTLLLHYHVEMCTTKTHVYPSSYILRKTHGYIGDLVIFNSSPSLPGNNFCAWVACNFFIGCHYSSLTCNQSCLSIN